MHPTASTKPRSGLAPALGAYVMWGFLPLYLILVRDVPAFEFVGWRIIWTLAAVPLDRRLAWADAPASRGTARQEDDGVAGAVLHPDCH